MAISVLEHRTDVMDEREGTRRGWGRCEIGENLRFNADGLSNYCMADWDPCIYDAFVVAAAVEFCDRMHARPSTDWGRKFIMRVPVHDLGRWRSPAVSKTLHDALTILTGDHWELEFKNRKKSMPSPEQRRLKVPGASSVIMPYSDGLDSYATAELMKLKHGEKLVRVRLDAQFLKASQNKRQSSPFASMPWKIFCGKRGATEPSALSRGFKFALLSGVAAVLCGTSMIIMPESGQGALGPCLVPVGQAHPDYRNHPVFTDRMEAFISAFFNHELHYSYPYLWNTKGDTLKDFFAKYPDDSNWMGTRSCWQGSRQVSVSGRRRHCGICAACLLRRMSVHAAGRAEDCKTYVWEDLGANSFADGAAAAFRNRNQKGALFEYAIAGVLHLDHLAGLGCSTMNRETIRRQVSTLSKLLEAPKKEILAKLERMLRQHENEWRRFVDSLGPQSFVAQWIVGGRGQ